MTFALLLLALAQQPLPEPVFGTFALDPVVLLRDGQEETGREEFELVHANWRYRFTGAATRDLFRAAPEKWEIQLGGACARMGALSGVGSESIWTVHEGRLYVFASDQCRETFLKESKRLLEPDEDPDFASTAEERARGAALLARAVEWLGGAERLDSAVVLIQRVRTVESGGAQIREADAMLLAPGGRTRREQAFDQSAYVTVLAPDDAFELSPQGLRTLHAAARRALERRHHRDPIGLLQCRGEKSFVAASPAEGLLRIRYDGVTQDFQVDPATGEIRSQAHLGRNARLLLGAARRGFTRWETVTGLRVPAAWSLTWDGAPENPVDWIGQGYTIEVLDAVPEGAFARPR
jgi:hypothetical protein